MNTTYKTLFLFILLMLASLIGHAQSLCTVTGTIYKASGTACAACKITISQATSTGTPISGTSELKTADGMGVVSFTAFQSSFLRITGDFTIGSYQFAGGLIMFIPAESSTQLSTLKTRDDALLSMGALAGSAPSNATYITQTPNAGLSAEQAMSALGTGLVKNTTTTGVQSIAVGGTDYEFPLMFGARLTRVSNTVDLATTAVTPGSYTTADITIDAYGRITAAANGSGGGGTVTSVFGRIGGVVAATNDYTWAQVDKSTSSFADIATRSASDINAGTLPLGRLVGITNTEISNSAAIAYSKLNLASSILNADVSNSAAIAYSKLALTGGIVNADINASAAVAYSKLNLNGAVVNADIGASAAIAYSKLALTGAVLNADLAGSIANAKLANSSVTLGATSVSLGATAANIAGLTTLGIGTTSPATNFHVADTSTATIRGLVNSQHSDTNDSAQTNLLKSRGTNASPTVITTGDVLGNLIFRGYDGANYLAMASIRATSTGTVASTRVPTTLIFATGTDAAPSVLTTAITIGSDQSSTFAGQVIPSAAAKDLGAVATPFRNLYIYGAGTFASHSIKFDGTPTGNRTQTFPDNTGTVSNLNLAQTWSANQTFGSGNLLSTLPQFTTGLNDSAGNRMITFNAVASAVNNIRVDNAASAGHPLVMVEGATASINLGLIWKGTGSIGIGGTSASFPGLSNSGTTLQITTADRNSFAPVNASGYQASNTSGAYVFGTAGGDASIARTGTGALRCTNNSTSFCTFLIGTSSDTVIGKFSALDNSATTNALVDVAAIGVNSTGTPAAGFGPLFNFTGETSTTINTVMGKIGAVFTTVTHATRVSDLVFQTVNNAVTGEAFRVTGNALPVWPNTVTTGGTTGAQTIDKPSGTVNFAAAATTLVVTNALVTTSSIVFAVIRTNDTTATIKNVVPAAGSFTITLGAAATAETSVGFFVINK